MSKPNISVVINTYNRASDLPNTLRSLANLDYDNFEVVVVNGPSTDNTNEVLAEWADSVKVLQCPLANLSVSRNEGIANSGGDIVAFIDDDAIPHPTWLSRLAVHYADLQVGGVGGFTVDNTGVKFQARKTICDRYGNAHFVSDYFDERALNRPNTPFYPSLLGTNSSFRRDALVQIGGFDHAFAYLLDETDVCLRIIDAGFRIIYEPSALVFHQFSPSHIRTKGRVAKTVYPSSVSKSYFIMRHGLKHSVEEAGKQLEKYREEILTANRWMAEHGEITWDHRVSLDQDLMSGIADGRRLAYERGTTTQGNLGSPMPRLTFKRFPRRDYLRIALVSQGFPPTNEAGIARWTSLVASGLSARGHAVHVITRATTGAYRRYQNGYWAHATEDDPIAGEVVAARLRIPPNIAARACAVSDEVTFIKSFGLDVVSFPIWDLEGIACLEMSDVGLVLSLHTSYSLAKPHKPEWQARPLYEHFFVDQVIQGEKILLEKVPTIVANSNAIVADLTIQSGVEIASRALLCVHGTLDPLAGNPKRLDLRSRAIEELKLVYVGRFERRKGFDIAVRVFSELLTRSISVRIDFAGDTMTPSVRELVQSAGASKLLDSDKVRFVGLLDREELDDLYASATLVFMPSRYESFGLVAIEAMAAGAPVVGFAAGGLAEVIENDVSGIAIPAGGNEFGEALRELDQLIREPDRLKRLSAGARSAFEKKYSIDAMIDALEIAYRKAAEKVGR